MFTLAAVIAFVFGFYFLVVTLREFAPSPFASFTEQLRQVAANAAIALCLASCIVTALHTLVTLWT